MTTDSNLPVRVFVVEDQPNILRQLLRLLQTHPEIQVVGSALSGEAALVDLEQAGPAVVLSDLGLPRMSGIELTQQIKHRFPSVEVLIFTIFDEEDKVLDAIRAGASGYLLKGAPLERIVDAIRDVRDGGSVIQPNLARRLLRTFHVTDESGPAASSGTRDASALSATGAVQGAAKPLQPSGGHLTAREAEILQLIAKGLSNTEAASVLGLSRATVRTHLEHIYSKLEVTNRVEAVTEGIRKGLIQVP